MAISKSGDIYTELSKKYGLHRNTIMSICNHVFIFTARRIADPEDERTIMLPYFGKIRVRKRFLGRKKEKVKENEQTAMFKKESGKSI